MDAKELDDCIWDTFVSGTLIAGGRKIGMRLGELIDRQFLDSFDKFDTSPDQLLKKSFFYFRDLDGQRISFLWYMSCLSLKCLGKRKWFRNSARNNDRLVEFDHSTNLKSLIHLDRDRQSRFANGLLALVTAIAIAMFLVTSALAQEQEQGYSEYTYWFGGAFQNGHALSSTVGGRNYQLEGRYERLIYRSQPFAVRWVFDAVPVALVGDPRTSTGRRGYSYGIGGSPVGARANLVRFRRVEPFLTSGGGFLYFNHRMFGTTQQFNFTAQLGGGVQLFASGRRTAIDLGYNYHHISNANLANQNPGLGSHILFIGVSLFR